MEIPDVARFMIRQPDHCLTLAEAEEVARIRQRLREPSGAGLIQPELVSPWKLLARLSRYRQFMFHGSTRLDIEEFVPRACQDSNPFGAQAAVFAASEGVWSMFYAVLDREHVKAMHNGCVSFIGHSGERSVPYHFLSIGKTEVPEPFSAGAVYILPAKGFVQDPMNEMGGIRFDLHHWASPQVVRPLGVIPIEPSDYPFLRQIRRHEPSILVERMEADPAGFPWVDEMY